MIDTFTPAMSPMEACSLLWPQLQFPEYPANPNPRNPSDTGGFFCPDSPLTAPPPKRTAGAGGPPPPDPRGRARPRTDADRDGRRIGDRQRSYLSPIIIAPARTRGGGLAWG